MEKPIKSIEDLIKAVRPFWKRGWRIKRFCNKKYKNRYDIGKVTLISPNKILYIWEDVKNPVFSELDKVESGDACDIFYTINQYFESRKYGRRA